MNFEEVSDGIYKKGNEYFTLNLAPGRAVYGEELFEYKDKEYRHWDPRRSKLAAFLKREGSLPLEYDMDVLYLGAGDGTTVSHVADILTHGKVFAVELSGKPYTNLLELSKHRKNIFPILEDAGKPEKYSDIIPKVDFLYQDISQKDQSKIFLKNVEFLKEKKYGFIAVKCRSIDVTKSPNKIYSQVENTLRNEGLDILGRTDISRWQKDHAIIITRKAHE
ncbi:MAG: fibrillarin-like rRNA/tRNA 2'-O-methyltransferase [Thermoplasmatota archaeon]